MLEAITEQQIIDSSLRDPKTIVKDTIIGVYLAKLVTAASVPFEPAAGRPRSVSHAERAIKNLREGKRERERERERYIFNRVRGIRLESKVLQPSESPCSIVGLEATKGGNTRKK